MANDWLKYSNGGAVRKQPLSGELVDALSFLPEMGLTMDVFSGGQPPRGLARLGSNRHNRGNAADAFFYKDGRKLDWSNEADVPLFQEIVRRAKQNGVTGFGAGESYMRPGSMHIGFGTPAVWGAEGSGENAAAWLREAYNGVKGTSINSRPTQTAAAPVQGGSKLPPDLIEGVMAAKQGGQPSVPPLDAPRDVATYEVAGVQPEAAPPPIDVFKSSGFAEGMKALGGNKDFKGGMDALSGLFGGGQQQENAQAREHAQPIQSVLPAMEAADAGRVQSAQQLMSAIMASKGKRKLGSRSRGTNLMG